MIKEDYKWFKENYNELFKEYGVGYLVIKDKKVLGKYSTYEEGVKNALAKEELGSFIVQLCNGNESAYTNYISSFNII